MPWVWGNYSRLPLDSQEEKLRPRRSILFLASTGEEYGDLGTRRWLRHPTWALENVAADLHFDSSPMELGSHR